jgi:sarcosine oxidase subunit delta
MLLLNCPYCNLSCEETEFLAGGQAHIKRQSIDSSDQEFESYLFARKNPKGVHIERWQHLYGCGKWFHVARSTVGLTVHKHYHLLKRLELILIKNYLNGIGRIRNEF